MKLLKRLSLRILKQFMAGQRILPGIKSTEQLMIFVYREQSQICLLFQNTVCRL